MISSRKVGVPTTRFNRWGIIKQHSGLLIASKYRTIKNGLADANPF